MPPEPIFNIPEVDAPFSTFLPAGWVGLIMGSSGTHLLSKQFSRAGLGRVPVLYYTTYERVADVERAFKDFGWDASGLQVRNVAGEYYDQVLSRELAVAKVRDRGLSIDDLNGAASGLPPSRSYDLTRRLIADLSALDSPFRMVIDSVDFLLDIVPPPEVVNLARQIRYRAQTLGGQAFLVLRPDIHDRKVEGALEDLSDVVVRISAQPKAESAELVLVVEKMRNHPERTRSYRVSVGRSGLVAAAPDGDARATEGTRR